MNLTNNSVGRVGLACGLLTLSLTGCVVVRETPTRTVYVDRPVAHVPVAAPQPTVVVIRTEQDFHEPLAPYGEWIVVGNHGRCWRPVRVASDWRPYGHGHWQRTDAGWFWASDEPWAWATYHYGRWDWTPRYGWIWVPQTEWAPAWVSWRHGQGYIGWAPLPPSARITVDGTVHLHEATLAPRFVFVEERRLLEPVRPTTVIVNNTTVINKTVNITKIKVVNKTVINEGPRTEVVERASGRRIHSVAVTDLRHRAESDFVARHRRNTDAPVRTVEPSTPVASEPKTVSPRTVTPTEPAETPRPDRSFQRNRVIEARDRAQTNRANRTETRSTRPSRDETETVRVVPAPETEKPKLVKTAPEPDKAPKPARESRRPETRGRPAETDSHPHVTAHPNPAPAETNSRLQLREAPGQKQVSDKKEPEDKEKKRIVKPKGRGKGEAAEPAASTNAPAAQ